MYGQLENYIEHLMRKERCRSTVNQYRRDISAFIGEIRSMSSNGYITKEMVIEYKMKLCERYRISSVNTKLAAINEFLEYTGRGDLKVKTMRVQRRAYCSGEKELTKREYLSMIDQAIAQGDERMSMLMQTLGGTGIRISELKYITVEAVKKGEANIWLKGKNRTVLIAGRLKKRLQSYIRRKRLTCGPIFVTRGRRPLDRSNIWKMMKRLGEKVGASREKVFPHNVRHLFARCFYEEDKDIAKLADVLGHSNIDTTRIYIMTSGCEHRRKIELRDRCCTAQFSVLCGTRRIFYKYTQIHTV